MLIEANPSILEMRAKMAGVSNRELCRLSGVAISQWMRWKHGRLRTAPRLDKVIALNVVIEDLERAL